MQLFMGHLTIADKSGIYDVYLVSVVWDSYYGK